MIRGVFDARQHLGRSYSVFYFYARYVARESIWIRKEKAVGLTETVLRIFKTFIGLSDIQKVTSLI
jgi:hypothetical protein